MFTREIIHTFSYWYVNNILPHHTLRMSIQKLFLFILFFIPSLSYAEDKYTKEQVDMYRLVQTITVIDWAQTIHIASESDNYSELNPLLDKHPSVQDVNRFVIKRMIVQHLMFALAPPSDKRNIMLEFAIIGGLCILRNQYLGVEPHFKAYQAIPLAISYTWKF